MRPGKQAKEGQPCEENGGQALVTEAPAEVLFALRDFLAE